MKLRKVLLWTVGIIAGWLLVGCGPSAEEKRAMDLAKEDSIAAANQAVLTTGVPLTTETALSCVKLIATTKTDLHWTSSIEVFMVGGDTIIVVNSPGCDNIAVIKK